MKTMTVAEAARNFDTLLGEIERDHEEVVIVRAGRPVVRVVPEPEAKLAFDFFDSSPDGIDSETAAGIVEGIDELRSRSGSTLDSLRDPWGF